MAAKRIVQSSINWTEISLRVPPAQRPNYLAFKTKSDGYMKSLMQYPENPPKFDWAQYKKFVPVAGMVDNFQKQYEALKVPFPADNYTKNVDEQEKVVKSEIEAFKTQSSDKIKSYQADVTHLSGLLPFDQMTMEDFKDSYPDLALDPIKKPTFWPHDAEEQMDYRDKGHPLHGTDPHQH